MQFEDDPDNDPDLKHGDGTYLFSVTLETAGSSTSWADVSCRHTGTWPLELFARLRSRKETKMKPFDVVEVTPPTGESFYAIVARSLSNSGIPVVRLSDTLQHHIVDQRWCKLVKHSIVIGCGKWVFEREEERVARRMAEEGIGPEDLAESQG